MEHLSHARVIRPTVGPAAIPPAIDLGPVTPIFQLFVFSYRFQIGPLHMVEYRVGYPLLSQAGELGGVEPIHGAGHMDPLDDLISRDPVLTHLDDLRNGDRRLASLEAGTAGQQQAAQGHQYEDVEASYMYHGVSPDD